MSLLQIYDEMCARGTVTRDPAQVALIALCEQLRQDITIWQRPRSRVGSVFAGLKSRRPPATMRGLYIYGSVGRGKSMLMDMFYDSLTCDARRRVHFHAFMQEVHQRIFRYRQRASSDDPLRAIATDIAREAQVLCFDEFHVSNIADASILGRLLEYLFESGVVMVATSNQSPDVLYASGLNRHRFLPAIALIKERLRIYELAVPQDYRLAKLVEQPVWFAPLDVRARMAMDARFAMLTQAMHPETARLEIDGRAFVIDRSAGGVARLSFAHACGVSRGASDYLALASRFHTLFIDDILQFTVARQNAFARFSILIDALYENRVNFIGSAQVPLDELYTAFPSVSFFDTHAELSAGVARTHSRLFEMQSQDYLAQPHKTR